MQIDENLLSLSICRHALKPEMQYQVTRFAAIVTEIKSFFQKGEGKGREVMLRHEQFSNLKKTSIRYLRQALISEQT